MPTTDADVPSNLPHRMDREHRVLVLAGMIMDAQAAGSALLESDWPEGRFRVGLIREVAQDEGLSEIHEDAEDLDLAISRAEARRFDGVAWRLIGSPERLMITLRRGSGYRLLAFQRWPREGWE